MEPKLSRYLHEKGRKLGLPVSGTLELTPRCNFNCKMCYIHLTPEEQRQRGSERTLAQWLALAQELREAGTVFLLLTGGEPFLRPDFPALYRALHRMGFILSINTNGYLLRGALRELLLEAPPARVNISLYGTDNKTYQCICGVAAYDRVMENIQALREAGIEVRISLTATPENADQMEEILRAAQRLGARLTAAPYLFPPLRAHPDRVGENYRVRAEEAGSFYARFSRLTRDRENFLRSAEALRAPSPARTDGGIRCRAGSTAFWVTWDGALLPCGQMTQPRIALQEGKFPEAWAALRRETAKIRLPEPCMSCGLRDACQPCAAKCLCETGHFDRKPEYVCAMAHAYREEMLKIREEMEHELQA